MARASRLGDAFRAVVERQVPQKSSGERMGDHITDPLIEYAREYAGAERPDYFIFGHMHQPRDYSEGNLRVLCLGEWHSDPVYAVIDPEGNASLKKY